MIYKEEIQTLSAEVKPLSDLLQYQEGSIVSRVLLKNKGKFRVTILPFHPSHPEGFHHCLLEYLSQKAASMVSEKAFHA
jgi:hypothetical protein